MLKIVLPIIVIVVSAAGAAGLLATREKEVFATPEPVVPVVRVLALEPVDHRFTVEAQGVVQPRVEIQLTTEVAGRVIEVAPGFAVGGFFDPNEVLIRLDSRDYELALARAQASLAEAQVRLQREEAEARVAREEWEEMGASGFTSGSGPRAEPSPLLLREPQLAEARAGVASAEASVRLAELDLERCVLKAPFAGRVREKTVDVGQYVNRTQAVARIYSVEDAEIRLPLALDELRYLDLPMGFQSGEGVVNGPKVRIRAQMGGKRVVWPGRIVRTEGEVDARTRMVTVVVRVANPQGRGLNDGKPPLVVGLFVNAEIEGRPAGNVLRVPRSAMRGDDRLLVVDGEDRLRFRSVDVVRFEGDHAVLSKMLEVGDRICLSPLATPVDGMRVQTITEERSSQ
jgi:RND family efflux transporter MFP subunit